MQQNNQRRGGLNVGGNERIVRSLFLIEMSDSLETLLALSCARTAGKPPKPYKQRSDKHRIETLRRFIVIHEQHELSSVMP